jgi:hypothetical protein
VLAYVQCQVFFGSPSLDVRRKVVLVQYTWKMNGKLGNEGCNLSRLCQGTSHGNASIAIRTQNRKCVGNSAKHASWNASIAMQQPKRELEWEIHPKHASWKRQYYNAEAEETKASGDIAKARPVMETPGPRCRGKKNADNETSGGTVSTHLCSVLQMMTASYKLLRRT